MIEIFTIALLAFVLAMLGMALSRLAGHRRLGGGCAGLRAAVNCTPGCEACGQGTGTGGCTGIVRPSGSGMAEA